MHHRVGAPEDLQQVGALHVRHHPLGLGNLECGSAPRHADDRIHRRLLTQDLQHARSDIAGRPDDDYAHPCTSRASPPGCGAVIESRAARERPGTLGGRALAEARTTRGAAGVVVAPSPANGVVVMGHRPSAARTPVVPATVEVIVLGPP
jgi:hypothetical protein